jgi:hypothetical protein
MSAKLLYLLYKIMNLCIIDFSECIKFTKIIMS